MQLILPSILLSLVIACSAQISGPYLLWGHDKVFSLQPSALVEAQEKDLTQLFQDVKAIVVFVHNTTTRLEGTKYPKFQNLIKSNVWTYLPQRTLSAEPFMYNANIEVINLSGVSEADDEQLISAYNDALTIYGNGEVLGILANREDETHYLVKREAKEETEDESRTTTAQTPTAAEETDKSCIYISGGNKAALYVESSPLLKLRNVNETFELIEHNKEITFDDQRQKGYGRLNILFVQDGEKLFLRFNFTLRQGTWYMSAVEVEHRDIKAVLPAVGNLYTIPSAPVGFSYRCSARDLIFSNKNDSLILKNYQVQPWLNGRTRFSDRYDCIGFTSAPILAGVLVSFFLCGILAIGVIAMMDMHTPNRFESSRNKQLTFAVQE